jgi:protein-tyrosine phosphatase
MIANNGWVSNKENCWHRDEFGMTTDTLQPLETPPGTATCADIHCHCLPGLDDGAATVEEALAMGRALVEDGVTDVIATPHQGGRYAGTNGNVRVRAVVAEYQRVLEAAGVPLRVLPGADVRVDEELVKQIQADQVLTLGDRRKHALLELPHEAYFEPWGLLSALESIGIQSILSHPERHHFLQQHPAAAGGWVEHGVLLQVTAGSLTGDFGEAAQRCGWQLLTQGCVSFLATDAHDCENRPPRMRPALKLITEKLGATPARRLVENARRVWNGEAIAVPFVPMLAARRR